ncbi:MAG: Hpt domain-containing protein [Halorhodospira halophila]|uniref:Hpt domain-containing protein n=1 Tax=Halorhodospira TaxID=85108 RepID=UPI001911CC1D|nr:MULTISPECIES: Hpt domain-containing protein [Halorhodospira]MCC3750814.1 Hpt domain-containing protein [Halorhodospira halophila]MCG5527399.1 Hpt domain-containing protein [Halorhodospira halophila]MCG5532881.1 Hpt domain-containing protein [Halorhodospira sp. 9621]MCG5538477.1 Hpt domain-containing protein [Halorhodospira sp. 9622]MCG5543607.1 Hpt domain-containing protein [Halorhodospira sp. 9628]
MSDHPVIDLEELLDNLGRDEQLADMLLERMQEDLPSRLAALREALEQGDPQAVHAISHPVKGALASVRAVEARECARRLDDAARTGDLQTAWGCLPELERAAERLEAAIDARRARTS